MEDLNRRAKEFVDEWCNETHTTTKRIPNLHYLQDEKHMLQPLPKTRYRLKKPVKRTISADSMISINANKYSVPVDYATKKMWYRIVYGFRIEIYANENDAKPVLTIEEAAGKGGAYMNAEHYEAIAKKVSTSIPQIKRDFTARFSNGKRYLDAAKLLRQNHHDVRAGTAGDLFFEEPDFAVVFFQVAEQRLPDVCVF